MVAGGGGAVLLVLAGGVAGLLSLRLAFAPAAAAIAPAAVLGEPVGLPTLSFYAGALAVIYAPYDEDFGYVTLESFLARKPVVTANDSGGTNEFVEDGVNGYVCEPAPAAIAEALSRLAADRSRAAAMPAIARWYFPSVLALRGGLTPASSSRGTAASCILVLPASS